MPKKDRIACQQPYQVSYVYTIRLDAVFLVYIATRLVSIPFLEFSLSL